MIGKEKAIELVNIFGKELALKVVDELLSRDIKWINKLCVEYPEDWKKSDINKSQELYNDVKNNIKNL